MAWIAECFRTRATESQTSVLIGVCVVVMSVMAIGIVWQAEIIANQREAIHWLATVKFGG